MADGPKSTWWAHLEAWLVQTFVVLGVISGGLALFSYFTLDPVIEKVVQNEQNPERALVQRKEAFAIVLGSRDEIVDSLNLDELSPETRAKILAIVTPAITQAATPFATTPTIDLVKEVDKQVESLAGRVEQIESRLPSETTIDKVASVNEALLALHVEVINRRLD